MWRFFVLVGLFLSFAGCATCPSDQELVNIAGDAQFNTGYLHLAFEANSDMLPTEEQHAVQEIGRHFAEELKNQGYSDVYAYVATGRCDGDSAADSELSLRRFGHLKMLLENGGLDSSKISGVAELPKREQLLRSEDGVFIGLRCR